MSKEPAFYQWNGYVEEAPNSTTLIGLRLSDPVLKAVDHCCELHDINRSDFLRIATHLLLQSPIHRTEKQ
jgi:hypothetical protein